MGNKYGRLEVWKYGSMEINISLTEHLLHYSVIR